MGKAVSEARHALVCSTDKGQEVILLFFCLSFVLFCLRGAGAGERIIQTKVRERKRERGRK